MNISFEITEDKIQEPAEHEIRIQAEVSASARCSNCLEFARCACSDDGEDDICKDNDDAGEEHSGNLQMM